MWNRLLRNAFSNVAGMAIGMAIGFVTMPLVVRHLGPTQFGIWMLATGLTGYMGLFDVGLGPTIVKKSSELLARGDAEAQHELTELVSTVHGLYVLAAALGFLALLGVGQLADALFTVAADDLGTFRIVLFVVAAQTALGLPMSVWTGLLAGLEAFPAMNAIGIATSALRGALTVLLVLAGYGLLALVLMGAAVSVVGWTANRLVVRRRIPTLRVTLGGFRRARLGEIGAFSWAMLAWTVAGAALHQLDRVLIGIVLPIRALATYEIGSRLTNYSRAVLHSWLSIVMPAASGLAARGERGRLRGLYLRGTRYLVGCYAGIALVLVGLGWPFIRLWIGSEYGESYVVMTLLLLGSLVQSQTVVAHVMLPAVGDLRAFTRFMQGYPVVTATCAVVGIQAGGLVGLACGIAVSMIVMESLFVAVLLRRLGVRADALVRRCHGPVLRATLPAALWLGGVRAVVSIDGWGALVVAALTTGLVYAAGFWIAGLTAGERRLVRRRIATLARRSVVRAPLLEGGTSC